MRLFLLVVAAVLTVSTGWTRSAPASVMTVDETTFDGQQPQIVAFDRQVAVTFGRGDRVYVATSRDGGMTFGKPVVLPVLEGSGHGRLALGRRRGPRIAMTPRAIVVSMVMGEKGGGTDGDVVVTRSIDGGAHWSAIEVVNDVPGAAREGMHALAASGGGLVVATWLDLRQRGTRIYAAVSRGNGRGWYPDVLVYESPSGSVCECCHPSVSMTYDGTMAIMFRNRIEGQGGGFVRDMYVAVSRDGGHRFATPRKQGQGTWALDACPMDGGDVEWTDGRTTSVWRRDGEIFTVSGEEAERRLGQGADPTMGVFQRDVDVAWNTPEGIMLRRNDRDPVIVDTGRFPVLATLHDRTIVAYEHDDGIRVRVIPR
jgi:hypothetical protein